MPPIYSKNDDVDRAVVNTILQSNSSLAHCSRFVQLANCANILLRECVAWVLFSVARFWIDPSTFLNSIPNIIFCRTKKKMIPIATRRIVAVVTHIESKIKVSVKQNIGYTMGRPILVPKTEHSVPSVDCGSGPRPALIWAPPVHLGPESFSYLFWILKPLKIKSVALFTGGVVSGKLFHSFSVPAVDSRSWRAFSLCPSP